MGEKYSISSKAIFVFQFKIFQLFIWETKGERVHVALLSVDSLINYPQSLAVLGQLWEPAQVTTVSDRKTTTSA